MPGIRTYSLTTTYIETSEDGVINTHRGREHRIHKAYIPAMRQAIKDKRDLTFSDGAVRLLFSLDEPRVTLGLGTESFTFSSPIGWLTPVLDLIEKSP